ncbi:conserved hypothetical protein [Roseibium sp. TrichSKD4]|uniref:hypothetical protein n=1 Tax=Roseibium sp. TrichSKD4 TaxID=744980 RepID=UPI0001E5637E|nr:hypothetical protein [Roseibium sp. TrichSKD4]EFO33896.1 conserved hypothetical protein [Roseibium sp. TrichSKD4]
MLEWPDDLPKPQRSSYQRQPQDPRLKRRRETGPPSFRRRFSSVAQFYGFSISVDRDQKAVFDQFYHHATLEGTRPFVMPDPTSDGWWLLDSGGERLLTPTGEPLLLSAPWICLFGEQPPNETTRGIRFQISFPIVVMP